MNQQHPSHHSRLYATIDHLFEDNKGILAADESTKSANKRLEALGIAPDAESRRSWRELLFSTPNLDDFISGVILYDETIRQKHRNGANFAKFLAAKGIIPGIKVDMGLVDLTNFPNETITEGLDGLEARLREYYAMGARFAKWRAAFAISSTTPSEAAIHANANVFGRYASLCQANGIVPIIEPEVLYDGPHSIEEALKATTHVLKTTLEVVEAYGVDLKAVILKTSMVLAGAKHSGPSTPQEVAAATLQTLHSAVPSEVGGVVFLSGGQSPAQATANLNEIGKHDSKEPWPITYSFSRAVQDPVMHTWRGKAENAKDAQKIFYHRLACNSAARHGAYRPDMEVFNKSNT